MGTGAQNILNQVDKIGNGAMDFSTGLMDTSIGQYVIVGFGLAIFALILYIAFSVFQKVRGGVGK